MQSHSISKMYTFYTQVLHHIATVGNRKGELIYKYIMCEMVCVFMLFEKNTLIKILLIADNQCTRIIGPTQSSLRTLGIQLEHLI